MPLPIAALVGIVALPAITLAISTALSPPLQQGFNRLAPILVPGVEVLVTLRRRELLTQADFLTLMRRHGFSEEQSIRVQASAEFYPAPSDLVSWQAREVYEADAVAKYGLEAELDSVDPAPFLKGGVNNEQMRNFWLAHWQHPPFNQVAEMLSRDIIINPGDRDTVVAGSPEWEALREREKQDLYEWYRLVEVPPYWRDKLTELAFNPYTRVDIRRMYDMRLVDRTEVLRNYLDLGSDLEHAEKLTDFALVSTEFPDLMSRFRNGWITSVEVVARLVELGLPADRAQEFLETRMHNLARPQRVAQERDLVKSEIIKGVKKFLITPSQGIEMLVAMGYDAPEAEFILLINIEGTESPEGVAGFQQLVQSYRASVGQESQPVGQSVVDAEKAFRVADAALIKARTDRVRGGQLDGIIQRRNTALMVYQSELQRSGLPASDSKRG